MNETPSIVYARIIKILVEAGATASEAATGAVILVSGGTVNEAWNAIMDLRALRSVRGKSQG